MKTRLAVGALMLAFALPLAQAQHVNTDFDHKAPFSDYHTFSFYKVQTLNPLDASVLKREIRRDLTYHGWQEVPRGGDVAITLIGGQTEQRQYQSFYDGMGPGWGWGGWGGWWGMGWGGPVTTTEHNIPLGTLVVDLYDTHTHQLVWRGVSHETESGNMEKNTGKMQKAIDEMFYKFPPKK